MQKTHLGIYAIIEKDDFILVVKKTRGPYQGMWDLPGGGPEFGESIQETLKREVFEETGLMLSEALLLKNIVFTVAYEEHHQSITLHHTCLIYKPTVESFSCLQPDIHKEDVAGASWIKKEELKTMPISKVIKTALFNL